MFCILNNQSINVLYMYLLKCKIYQITRFLGSGKKHSGNVDLGGERKFLLQKFLFCLSTIIAILISTEGALRLPTAYDDHVSLELFFMGVYHIRRGGVLHLSLN